MTDHLVTTAPKQPFDIDIVMQRLRVAVAPYPKAALFELYDRGYRSPFEQLIACIISIRTYDETTLPAAERLFQAARSPQAIAALDVDTIDRLISPSTFHERKAGQIQRLAQRVHLEFSGQLPCNRDLMMTFEGVGVKCANLAAGVACGSGYVSADIHVHRVANRWGYIHTAAPEASSAALENKLPPRYHIEINALLVPFGKHICTGKAPHCSTCPLLDMCRQVGVTRAR